MEVRSISRRLGYLTKLLAHLTMHFVRRTVRHFGAKASPNQFEYVFSGSGMIIVVLFDKR